MEAIRGQAESLGIDFFAVDLDSIHLPTGQDFGIESDDEEDLMDEGELEFEGGFGSIVVVDNLPKVTREKFERLEGQVRKIYSQAGEIVEDGLYMPVDAQGKTLGYCFIEFNTPQNAELAKKSTHGHRLGRSSHVLAVNMFDEIEKFLKVPSEWVPPETKLYTPGENLQHWLTDYKARDQFVIRAGSETEVLWNDVQQLKPDPVYKKSFWTESFVHWSPLGTYLATLHRLGTIVWGGATTFNLLMRYAHPDVQLIDFSPGEKFLVTFNRQVSGNPRESDRVLLNIFDVRTGKLMRDFRGSADEFGGIGSAASVPWPVFRWSSDKYFARLGKNVISVYETETFSLIDKKSIKVENVVDFSWSPTDPMLSLFVPELGSGNQPARVSLVQIPGKEELRQKNLFCVSDCKMYWQSSGDYLAVKVERYTKTKKSTYTGLELFRIRERDIPIEVLELDNRNDKIIAFAWEPKGHRFAVIHGDNPRPDVSFYTMRTAKHTSRVSKLATVKSKQANSLFWSPTGRFIVLAGLKGMNGQLEFFNVDELETMATAEHFMATDVEWDPTGRYVATASTSLHHDMENGFNIWSFCGKLLYQIRKDHFFQFGWRPRPPTLLSPDKEEEISKSLKKYSKKYEAEDQDISLQLSEQEREKRKITREEWDRWVSEWKQLQKEEKAVRQQLRDGEASDDEEEFEAKEVQVEELINVTEEVIISLD